MGEFEFLMPDCSCPAFSPDDAAAVQIDRLHPGDAFMAMYTGRHVVAEHKYPNVLATDAQGNTVVFGHRALVLPLPAADVTENEQESAWDAA